MESWQSGYVISIGYSVLQYHTRFLDKVQPPLDNIQSTAGIVTFPHLQSNAEVINPTFTDLFAAGHFIMYSTS